MRSIGEARSGAIRFAGLAIPLVLMLVCTTAAFAQSADDQYGSPVGRVRHAVEAVGVLPNTGGPLPLLIIGGVLIVVGAGLAIRYRITAGRR